MSIEHRFMEFRLGSQLYAIPLLSVKEVLQKPELTPVPNMPPHFEGMINLRGQILGIMNVRRKLSTTSQTKEESSSQSVVIVIEDQGVLVGMTVDEVTRVIQAKDSQIGPAPLKEGDPAQKFVTSVIQLDKELILALNLFELLELKKYQQLAESA